MRGNGVEGGSGGAAAGDDDDEDAQTFADLFWDTFHGLGWEVPPTSATGWTFMFELTGPANRVVVQHDAAGLTLLGARHRVSGKEVGPDAALALAQREYAVRVGRAACGR